MKKTQFNIFLLLFIFNIFQIKIDLVTCKAAENASNYNTEQVSNANQPQTEDSTGLTINPENKRISNLIEKFFEKNIIALICLEMEFFLFGAGALYKSDFGLKRFGLVDSKVFVNLMIKYWENYKNPNHQINSEKIVDYYRNNREKLKSKILPGYTEIESKHLQFLRFYRNLKLLNCENQFLSYILLSLIFEFNLETVISSLLFFTLVCSLKELKYVEFRYSFSIVMHNQNNLGSKIQSIGGKQIETFFQDLRNFLKFLKNVKFQVVGNNDLKNLFDVSDVNVSEFGYKLCICCLEIFLLKHNVFEVNDLLLFLSARLTKSVEVLLGLDILKLAIIHSSSIAEAIPLLLFDTSFLLSINNKISYYYGLDITNLNLKFKPCLEEKNNYYEFSNLVLRTDYQIKTAMNRKMKLEAKKKKKSSSKKKPSSKKKSDPKKTYSS